MNGHTVETINHLTEVGVKTAETMIQDELALKDLNVSGLTITRTKAPRKVPKVNSKEVWGMKTCTDHSTLSIFFYILTTGRAETRRLLFITTNQNPNNSTNPKLIEASGYGHIHR